MFVVVSRYDRMRARVEDDIRALYAGRYGAVLTSFAQTIVAELSDGGRVQCAAGLRFGHEALFSEHYLDLPVEQVLEDRLAQAVDRGRLVEVCHLAGTGSGHSLPFVRKLVAMLRDMGTEWAIFTATRPLRALLLRSGVSMLDLGRADKSRIPDPAAWGDYFEHDPRIMAVGQRCAPAARRFTAVFAPRQARADARVF